MVEMKNSQWICLVACATWLGTNCVQATEWYVNDADTTLDVYCRAAGNDANDGLSRDTPKLTIAAVGTSTNFMPGDTLYIDTGTYNLGNNPVAFTRSGTPDARILVMGSPKGTKITSSALSKLRIQSSHADFKYLCITGTSGEHGLYLAQSMNCSFEFLNISATTRLGIDFDNSSGHCVRHSIIANSTAYAIGQEAHKGGNDFFSVSICSLGYAVGGSAGPVVSSLENSVVKAQGDIFAFLLPSHAACNNLFFASQISPQTGCGTLAEFESSNPEIYHGNAFVDALFVDEAKGDYHLQSPYGYWQETRDGNGYLTGGTWVTNNALAMSPGVDFGADNGYASWTNEPTPNGGRLNAGAYGGTEQASKSRPDGEKWLYAASFNDGGHLVGDGTLAWRAGGFGTQEKVRLEYTHDGSTWSNIALVAATDERYAWAVPAGADGAWTKWRVRTTNTTGWIASTNGAVFGVRANASTRFSYYVNDASTAGDVYCSAAGADGNTGVSSNMPKASLQAVLDTFQLLGGDVVYVDTGTYPEETVTFTGMDSGLDGTNRLRVVGSPNGTVFDRGNTTYSVFVVDGISHLSLEDLVLQGGRNGIYFSATSPDIRIAGTALRGNSYGLYDNNTASQWEFSGGQIADNGTAGVYRRGATYTNQISASVLWNNGVALNSPASLSVSNSVIGGSATVFGYEALPGDYNVLWNNGRLSTTMATLADLQGTGIGWEHSFVTDPLFKDADNGDFHPMSVTGRWNPAAKKFEKDSVHSPLIDAGDPAAPVGAETKPNGGRLNVGMYGGTAQASRSRTNAWVQALTFSDGGTLDAQQGATLRWNGGNYASGEKVSIWLSRDGGTTWEPLPGAMNVAADAGEYFYQNTDTNDASSLSARWKVELASGTSSACATNFTYKNGAYVFYVNDGSLVGDVYCTAVGNDNNSGMSKGAPMRTLSALLAKYALGAGDRVYVDTGSYDVSSAIVFTAGDSGTDTNAVQIIGSTNRAANGSLFGNSWTVRNMAFQFQAGASNIVLRNLIVTNTTTGVSVFIKHLLY